MRRPDVGALRQRVQIYNTVRVDNGMGGFTRSDPDAGSLIGTFWAKLSPATRREVMLGGKFEELVTHKVLVRYNAAFAEGQTIIHRGNSHYVLSIVDPTHKKEFLHLMTREGGPQ